ncbi:MAG: N-formylglutamate deformylase [Candidatus Azotimanducaceae bacterium]|jgi:N-formylglutamate deformylase
MILHIPHASTYIPPALRAAIVLSDADLARELLVMTDHYTDELFMPAAQPGDAIIRATVSRLVVDMERFVIDEQEPMASRGMGCSRLRCRLHCSVRAVHWCWTVTASLKRRCLMRWTSRPTGQISA